MGPREAHEVRQIQVQAAAPWSEQILTRVQSEKLTESSPGKNLRVYIDEKLGLIWQCGSADQKTNCILGCKKKYGQEVKQGDPGPLLCSGEIPPRALYPALGSSTGKTKTCWSKSRGRPQGLSEGQSTSPIRKH